MTFWIGVDSSIFIFGFSISSSQICLGRIYPASLYNIADVVISIPAMSVASLEFNSLKIKLSLLT